MKVLDNMTLTNLPSKIFGRYRYLPTYFNIGHS